MPHHEEFADPVVVPGPNVRSLFTITDEDAARFCPADGAVLVDLPPPTDA